jgi:hypothetical protein
MGNLWTAPLCTPEKIKHLEEVLHNADLSACITIDIPSSFASPEEGEGNFTQVMVD